MLPVLLCGGNSPYVKREDVQMISQGITQCGASRMLSLHQLTHTIYLLSDAIIDVENTTSNKKTLLDHLPTERFWANDSTSLNPRIFCEKEIMSLACVFSVYMRIQSADLSTAQYLQQKCSMMLILIVVVITISALKKRKSQFNAKGDADSQVSNIVPCI